MIISSQLLAKQTRSQPANMADWHRQFRLLTGELADSIDRAMLGARVSSCLGYAFASSYQSAVEHLFASVIPTPTIGLASLCVSEQGGNHPRAIHASLTHSRVRSRGTWRLSGEKSFVSGAKDAEQVFVACRTGEDQTGLPTLKVVSLPTSSPGLSIETLPTLPFIPEVSHGKVLLEDVEVTAEQILPGDGYLDYIKPFRTCEDIHVMAGVGAYLLGEGLESAWPQCRVEALLSLLLSFRQLAKMDLKAASTHIALAGSRARLHELISECESEFKSSSPKAFENWLRDKALLQVAASAHQRRTETAWVTLTP